MLKDSASLWLFISLLAWLLTAISVQQCSTFLQWKIQGASKVRIQNKSKKYTLQAQCTYAK